MNQKNEGCTCDTCKDLDMRIRAGAENLERLALQQSTPAHVSAQLQLCANTVRRGLLMPTAVHKASVLADYETLLENVMVSFALRTKDRLELN